MNTADSAVAKVAEEPAEQEPTGPTSMDWLYNPSFNSGDAAIIHSLQQANSEKQALPSTAERERFPSSEETSPIGSSQHGHTSRGPTLEHKTRGKKKKHKHKLKHHKKHKSQTETSDSETSLKKKQRGNSPPLSNSGKVFLEDIPGLTVDQSFRLDRRGDVNNAMYDSLYKMHIAKHRRIRNLCVGLWHGKAVDCPQGKKHKKMKQMRYFTGTGSSAVDAPQTWSGHRSEASSSLPPQSEFLSLSDSSAKQPVPSHNPLGVYDPATEMYLQGKAPDQKEKTVREASFIGEERAKRKMADYQKRLTENPQNIDLWLEFIADQENARPGVPESALLQIKLSMLEKALEKNPGAVRLRLAQLELCRDVWPHDKVAKEWKNLTFQHANDGMVWKHYLQTLQCDQLQFTIPRIMKAYGRCLTTLNTVKEGTLISHKRLPDTLQHMIEIFVLLCHMLKQAGHFERAISLWQAMLEFNLHQPAILDQVNHQERLTFLQTFWDSLSARLGEPGAQGWAHWVEHSTELSDCDIQPLNNNEEDEAIEEALLQSNNGDQSQTWLSMEMSREHRHWLAWRGPSLDDCEDPERIVLFDDLEKYLFTVDSSSQRFQLLCDYLHFLGVPLQQLTSAGRLGPHHPQVLHSPHQVYSQADNAMLGAHVGRMQSAATDQQDFAGLQHFIQNTVSQCLPVVSAEQQTVLTLMLIHFQRKKLEKQSSSGKVSKALVKEVKKSVKSFLKEKHNRNNLWAWEAYAQLLWQAGDQCESKQVLQMALALTEGNMRTNTAACKLCSTYAWQELQMHSPEGKVKATYVLCCLADGERLGKTETVDMVAPARMVRCRHIFQQDLQSLLKGTSQEDSDTTILSYLGNRLQHWAACYAIFQYATDGLDMASQVYGHLLQNLQTRTTNSEFDSCMEELIRKDYISLLQWHVASAPCPLRVLREPLLQALICLPESVHLLQLFVDIETRSSIAGRLRRFFQKAPHSTVMWLFAILGEVRRMHRLSQHEVQLLQHLPSAPGWLQHPTTTENGVSHQLRAWFERAISHSASQHCVLIWRLYFHFEMVQNQKARAKAVFYRSVQQCPWAKSLYVEYIQSFPSQLQEVIDLLSEKELRLHTPLEELELLMRSTKPSNQKTDPPSQLETT